MVWPPKPVVLIQRASTLIGLLYIGHKVAVLFRTGPSEALWSCEGPQAIY